MPRIKSLLKSQFLAFILAMLLIPVLLFLSQRLTTQLVDSSSWVEHTYEVLTHVERLYGQGELIETARRGFSITRQEQYLRPYYSAQQHVNEELDTLRHLTVDNPSQQAKLKAITPVIQSLISLDTKDIENPAHDAKQSGETMAQAKLLIDEFRVLVNDMRVTEEKLLTGRAAAWWIIFAAR